MIERLVKSFVRIVMHGRRADPARMASKLFTTSHLKQGVSCVFILLRRGVLR
jgi:hypothetical protein